MKMIPLTMPTITIPEKRFIASPNQCLLIKPPRSKPIPEKSSDQATKNHMIYGKP
tara:strand:- start:3 stop:167 length:165 start_codon:yes stop_codon:yes gene_type:complete